jgi:toxin ParE1/3/4
MSYCPVSGERIARDFVQRREAACLDLASFPERGSLRSHVRPGLWIVGYRRQASFAFVVTEAEVWLVADSEIIRALVPR